jgi:hypothetical protein
MRKAVQPKRFALEVTAEQWFAGEDKLSKAETLARLHGERITGRPVVVARCQTRLCLHWWPDGRRDGDRDRAALGFCKLPGAAQDWRNAQSVCPDGFEPVLSEQG